MKNKSSITSESHPLANTMLGAGAYSSDDVSNEQSSELSAHTNCPPISEGFQQYEMSEKLKASVKAIIDDVYNGRKFYTVSSLYFL